MTEEILTIKQQYTRHYRALRATFYADPYITSAKGPMFAAIVSFWDRVIHRTSTADLIDRRAYWRRTIKLSTRFIDRRIEARADILRYYAERKPSTDFFTR